MSVAMRVARAVQSRALCNRSDRDATRRSLSLVAIKRTDRRRARTRMRETRTRNAHHAQVAEMTSKEESLGERCSRAARRARVARPAARWRLCARSRFALAESAEFCVVFLGRLCAQECARARLRPAWPTSGSTTRGSPVRAQAPRRACVVSHVASSTACAVQKKVWRGVALVVGRAWELGRGAFGRRDAQPT